MKDEETDQLQDELIRLQIENARLRATIDRLEHQRRLENPASAKTGARAEKIRRLLIGHFWDKRRQEGYSGIQMLMAIALSNMCYALAFVFTLAQAEAVSIMRSVPWTWTFVFVFVSPILFLLIVSLYAGRTRYSKPYRIQRTVSKRYLLRLLIRGSIMAAYAGLLILSLMDSWDWLAVVLLVGPIIWGIIVRVRKPHAQRQAFAALLKKLNQGFPILINRTMTGQHQSQHLARWALK